MKVTSFMKRKVKTINKNQTLKEAALLMVENKIGSVVIVDGNIPIGIITKGDIVRHFISGDTIDPNKPLTDYIDDKEFKTLDTNSSLDDVKDMLDKIKKHHLVVVDAKTKELAGVISTMDIISMQNRISKAFPYFVRT